METYNPLFAHRHFEWLAKWAGKRLSEDQIKLLAVDLLETNRSYNATRFLHAALDEMHRHETREYVQENGK